MTSGCISMSTQLGLIEWLSFLLANKVTAAFIHSWRLFDEACYVHLRRLIHLLHISTIQSASNDATSLVRHPPVLCSEFMLLFILTTPSLRCFLRRSGSLSSNINKQTIETSKLHNNYNHDAIPTTRLLFTTKEFLRSFPPWDALPGIYLHT